MAWFGGFTKYMMHLKNQQRITSNFFFGVGLQQKRGRWNKFNFDMKGFLIPLSSGSLPFGLLELHHQSLLRLKFMGRLMNSPPYQGNYQSTLVVKFKTNPILLWFCFADLFFKWKSAPIFCFWVYEISQYPVCQAGFGMKANRLVQDWGMMNI